MKYVLILGLRFQKNCVYHPMLFERVRVAANIDCDKYIVSGNDVEGCGITVADKMKNILVKCFHKDEENVILEPKAMSTIQNLYYSCRLIPPGSKVIVVTSSFHMPRVRLLLQNFSNVSFEINVSFFLLPLLGFVANFKKPLLRFLNEIIPASTGKFI